MATSRQRRRRFTTPARGAVAGTSSRPAGVERMSEFQLLLWVVAAMQVLTVSVLVMAVSMAVVILVRRRRQSAR